MALQIRRGTNADRLTITPTEGELIYTTDSKRVFVGDGTTAGGNDISAGIESLLEDNTPQLGGNLDLNGNNIVGTGNINIDGTITATGNINLGDGVGNDNVGIFGSLTTSLVPAVDSNNDIGSDVLRWRNGYFTGLDVDGQIDAVAVNARLLADDSTISFDPSNGVFDGRFVGNLTGNADGSHTGTFTGNVIGTLDGDVTGSLFGDNSTLLIDGLNNVYTGNIRTDRLRIDNPDQPGDGLNGGTGEVNIDVNSNDNRSLLNLRRVSASDLTGDTSAIYGQVSFGRDDANGLKTTAIMFGRENGIFFAVDANGAFNASNKFLVFRDYKLGVCTANPTEALDVNGNANVSGTVTAQSFVQFGSLTTTERDALTASNGMVIYNSTDNKFQGYENGAWVNLV